MELYNLSLVQFSVAQNWIANDTNMSDKLYVNVL